MNRKKLGLTQDFGKNRKNNTACFIDQHFFGNFVDLPCNGIPIVVFENLTPNHNKAVIMGRTTTLPPCRATLIIETPNQIIQRDLESPINTQTLASTLNIQVEDLRRVSILCQGNPGGTCRVFFSIQKTFFICCSDKSDKKNDCGCRKKGRNQDTSFIGQHSFFSSVIQSCNGSTKVIFEDATTNHNKIGFTITSSTTAPCQAFLIIDTDHGIITRDIPNFTGQNVLGIQLEDVRRITVRCQGNPSGTCNLTFSGAKTFCVSSGPEEEKKEVI
jgi:hypothetical protein